MLRSEPEIAAVTRFPDMLVVTIHQGTEKALEAAEAAISAAAQSVEQAGGKCSVRKVHVSTGDEWARGLSSPTCEGMLFIEAGAGQRDFAIKSKRAAAAVLKGIGYKIGSLRTRGAHA